MLDFNVGPLTAGDVTLYDNHYTVDEPTYAQDIKITADPSAGNNTFDVEVDRFNMTIWSSLAWTPKDQDAFNGTCTVIVGNGVLKWKMSYSTHACPSVSGQCLQLSVRDLDYTLSLKFRHVTVQGGTYD